MGILGSLTLEHLMIFFVALLALILIGYVVTAAFLMQLLRRAGHVRPWSAWVPVWQQASLFELGGIRAPWAWAVGLFVLSLVSNNSLLPDGIGNVVSIVHLVLWVMVMVWTAKGVQAGTGTGGAWGVVLAVVLTPVWLIWQATSKRWPGYDLEAAVAAGGEFPLSAKDGAGDPYSGFRRG